MSLFKKQKIKINLICPKMDKKLLNSLYLRSDEIRYLIIVSPTSNDLGQLDRVSPLGTVLLEDQCWILDR